MTAVIQTAEEKFGEVLATGKHDTGDTVLLIRRQFPARDDRPFMTIRANTLRGQAAFHHGYYDMTEPEARTSFNFRTLPSQPCYEDN